MTARKPWEEEWVAKDADVRDAQLGVAIAFMAVGHARAKAQLVASAPDLYRALASLEWCNGEGRCPDCSAIRGNSHHDGCSLALALAKARGERT